MNQPNNTRWRLDGKTAIVMGAMVKARRDGKWMPYQVIEPKNKKAKEVFAGIMEMLSEDKEMQSDRRNLVNLCLAPQLQQPVTIQGAPRPKKIEKLMAV